MTAYAPAAPVYPQAAFAPPPVSAPYQAAVPVYQVPVYQMQPAAGYPAPVAAAPPYAIAPVATFPYPAATMQPGSTAPISLPMVVQNIPKDAQAGDYMSKIQHFGSGYAHWSSFPIKLHLPMNMPADWHALVDAGIRAWARYLPLRIASPQEPADIEIGWINHLSANELGITNLEIFNGRMRVTIYLLRPSAYASTTPVTTLSHVTMHEMGHALGLFGHSLQPSDLMAALNNKPSSILTPSARDLNTIRKVYESPGLPAGYQSGQPISWLLLNGKR